jgi:Predicted integral membrane protein (DUF2269)
MSFTDRLVLWLHIGLAIFTIGPVTVAISSTPRYIRKRNLTIVQYLYRMTRIFTILSLTVLIAGLILAQLFHDFSEPWLAVSGTLFAVAIVLLLLIMRDQHRAIAALTRAAADGPAAGPGAEPGAEAGPADHAPGQDAESAQATLPGSQQAVTPLAAVERGRITTMGGVVSVIWLVILVLMVWNS